MSVTSEGPSENFLGTKFYTLKNLSSLKRTETFSPPEIGWLESGQITIQ